MKPKGIWIERDFSSDKVAKILLLAEPKPGIYKVAGNGDEDLYYCILDGREFVVDDNKIFELI